MMNAPPVHVLRVAWPRERVHSPSSLSLARDCPRAWALCYVAKIRKPELDWADIEAGRVKPQGGQRGAALGKQVHAYAELYCSGEGANQIDWHGMPGRVLQSMLPHLPASGSVPRRYIERKFRVRVKGVAFRGVIDIDEAHAGVVRDHKTTRDIDAYGLTAETLPKDLQACLYVVDGERRAPAGADGLECHWVYGETDDRKRRRSLPVIAHVTFAQARAVCEDAADFARTLTYRRVLDAPANGMSCDNYGGCWYRREGHCRVPRPIGQMIAAHEKKEKEANEKREVTRGTGVSKRGRGARA